jgi:hypothetical protein
MFEAWIHPPRLAFDSLNAAAKPVRRAAPLVRQRVALSPQSGQVLENK